MASKNYLLRSAIANALHADATVDLTTVASVSTPGEIVIHRAGDPWARVADMMAATGSGRCLMVAAGRGTFDPKKRELQQATRVLLHLLVAPQARDESLDTEPLEDTLTDAIIESLHWKTLTSAHGTAPTACQQGLRLRVLSWRELPDMDYCRRDIEIDTTLIL